MATDILRFKSTLPTGGIPMYAGDWASLQDQMLIASLSLYSSLSPDLIVSGVNVTLSGSYPNSIQIAGLSDGYVLLGGEMYALNAQGAINWSSLYIAPDTSVASISRTLKSGGSVPVIDVKRAKIVQTKPSSGPYIFLNPLPCASSSDPTSRRPLYLKDIIALNSKKVGEVFTYAGRLEDNNNIPYFDANGIGLYSFNGFALCNGKNTQAKNLSGRFIVGTGSYIENQGGNVTYNYNMGDTNVNGVGEARHKLTIAEMPSHSHQQKVTANQGHGWYPRADHNADGNFAEYDQGVRTTSEGGNAYHENRPPYMALAYIQRIY